MCSNLFINEWIRRVVLSQNCPVETPRASGPHQAPLECGSHLCWTQMEAARLRESRSEDFEHVAPPSRPASCLSLNCGDFYVTENTSFCWKMFSPLSSTACDATDAELSWRYLPLNSLSDSPVCWPRWESITGLWLEIENLRVFFSPLWGSIWNTPTRSENGAELMMYYLCDTLQVIPKSPCQARRLRRAGYILFASRLTCRYCLVGSPRQVLAVEWTYSVTQCRVLQPSLTVLMFSLTAVGLFCALLWGGQEEDKTQMKGESTCFCNTANQRMFVCACLLPNTGAPIKDV